MVAFETLVLRKTPAVVSVARRIVGNVEDARDVAQMVFLRVWEQLSRYDETYSFNTWLYRIATNLSIDFLSSCAQPREGPRRDAAPRAPARERDRHRDVEAPRRTTWPRVSSRRSRDG